MKKKRVASINDFLGYKPQQFKSDYYEIANNAPKDDSGIQKTIGVIHPDGGIVARKQHGQIVYKDDEQKTKWLKSVCAEKDCPVCLLSDFADYILNEDGDFSKIDVFTIGKDRSVTFENLVGEGEWKTHIHKKRDQVIFGWLPIGNDEFDEDKPVKILIGPTSVLMDLQFLIRQQISDNGDEGDPLVEPYAIAFTYDKDAKDNKEKYGVYRVSGKIAKLNDDVNNVLESTLKDLDIKYPEELCEPTPLDDMMNALRRSWLCDEVPFEDFEKWYNEKVGGKKTEKKEEKKQTKKSSGKKKVWCEECEEGVELDDNGNCPTCVACVANNDDVPF